MATPSADTPTAPTAPPVPGASIYLDPRELLPAQNPRRKPVTRERIAEIAESMRKHHVLENLIVRRKGDGYQVVAGDTRQKAAIEAGLDVVPCVVRELNDVDMLELQLIENIQRNDMHPVDEGESFERLIKSKKHSVESLAITIGKSERWVWNRLAFTKLIPPLRDAFVAEEITASHAELLCRLEPADQKRINNGADDSDGLWRWDFLDTIDDQGKVKERDRRAVRSVRDVNDWIEHNVRLAINTPIVQSLIPEVEEVQLEAARENARVLQVATTHMLPTNPELKGRFDGVLTQRHWVRAGGKSACEFAERAVVVFGEGQGETLDVCVNKKQCAKHWPDHQPEAVDKRRKAKARREGGQDRSMEQLAAKRKAEEAERERLSTRWKAFKPALQREVTATVRKLKTLPPALLRDTLAAHRLPLNTTVAQLPHVLLVDAIGVAFDRAWSYQDEKSIVAWAKRVGVDPKKVEQSIAPNVKAMKQDDANTKAAKQKPARESLAKNVRPGVRKALAKRARKAGKKR